jgi:hypothetical protein
MAQAHVSPSIGSEVLIRNFDESSCFDFGSWTIREKLCVPIGNGTQNGMGAALGTR